MKDDEIIEVLRIGKIEIEIIGNKRIRKRKELIRKDKNEVKIEKRIVIGCNSKIVSRRRSNFKIIRMIGKKGKSIGIVKVEID